MDGSMPPHVLLSARLRYEEYADDLVPDVDRPDVRPWPVRADRGMSAFKLRGPCHTARGFRFTDSIFGDDRCRALEE